MNSRHAVFRVASLLLLATEAAFGQPTGAPRTMTSAAVPPTSPTITILAAATGALIRNQGASNAALDLGRVSYFQGVSAPGETSQRNAKSLVVSTRFALKVDCPGSSAAAKVSVTMSRLDSAFTHSITIDGTKLASTAQTLVQSMPCGSGGEHRLDVEVPVSTPAGSIGSTVAFVATLKR